MLLKFNDSKFEANHLFKRLYTVLVLSWKSVIFVVVIITFVSFAKRTGTEILFKLQVGH